MWVTYFFCTEIIIPYIVVEVKSSYKIRYIVVLFEKSIKSFT